ncbi:MAG: hypothetical protein IH963_13395 [Chloroflexi bacterium]|nr:hypothetical protein [Chloroflexota bacterium]
MAAAWCDFLEAHARKIYAMELFPGHEAAISLAKKIRQGGVKDQQSVKDIYDKHWAGLSTPAATYAALDVLSGSEWVRIESLETGKNHTFLYRNQPE